MKRWIGLALSVGLLFCLCGCNTTPLKEKLIVQGIGVDVAQEDFLVTVQVYSPSADNTASSESQLFSAQGKTVFEALRLIDENVGKYSYYSDADVIVFSVDALKRGLWKNLEFFIRSSEIGSNVPLAATEGKAADLFLMEKEGNNMPSQVLANALHYGKSDISAISGELMTVGATLLTKQGDVSLPVVKLNQKENKSYLLLDGVLMFQGDTPCGHLGQEDLWAYNWLNGYFDDRGFVLPYEGVTYSLIIRKCKPTFTATLRQGAPHISVKLELTCDLMESDSPTGMDEISLQGLEQAVQKRVEQLTLATLQKVVCENKSDVFRLERVLKQQQPAFFKTLKDPKAVMAEYTFDCDATVRFARAGQGRSRG